MDKAMEMGKISTAGSVQLFLGTSISTIIRAVGAIILGLLILESDYGLYTVALIPASTLYIVSDWGVGSALTRYCAKYRGTNELAEQRKIIAAGLIFLGAIGLLLTIVSLLAASFFASTIYHRPTAAFLITLASVTMFSGGISSGVASVFTGFEKMKLNSYLALISAIVYSLLSPLLVYFGYGAVGAIIGYTASSVVLGVISIVMLYFFVWKKLPSSKISRSEIVRTLKSLLSYGVPLGISGIVGSLGTPLFSFLMASYVSDVMIGNYKVATNFLILLSFLTGPITTVLFPAFSKLDSRTEKKLLKTVFVSSVKYTVLLLVPAAMAMVVLAAPLIGTLYGSKWSFAPPFLAVSAIINLLSLVGLRSMGSFLSAMGETRLLLEMSVLSFIIAIPVAFLFVPALGIIGMIIGLAAAALPSTFIGLYQIWKRYGAKADFGASARILLASSLATGAVYLFLYSFSAASLVLLVLGSIIFVAVYLISVPLVGAINQSDVFNLRTMLSGLGIISRLLEIPLKIIERLLKMRTVGRKDTKTGS